MQKKNYKGRCEKLSVSKSKDVCHIYNDIQKKYLFKLQDDSNIKEIRCNVLMEGLELGDFTSDFQCITKDNDMMPGSKHRIFYISTSARTLKI